MNKKAIVFWITLSSVISTQGFCQALLFKKEINGSDYRLTGTVKIENGKGDKKSIAFTALVPRSDWDRLSKKQKSQSEYFSTVAWILSYEAKHSLKNSLSFEPFQKQFFTYSEGKFASNYKAMGRNGYGNLVETEIFVLYDPDELNKDTTSSADTQEIDTTKNKDSVKPRRIVIPMTDKKQE